MNLSFKLFNVDHTPQKIQIESLYSQLDFEVGNNLSLDLMWQYPGTQFVVRLQCCNSGKHLECSENYNNIDVVMWSTILQRFNFYVVLHWTIVWCNGVQRLAWLIEEDSPYFATNIQDPIFANFCCTYICSLWTCSEFRLVNSGSWLVNRCHVFENI